MDGRKRKTSVYSSTHLESTDSDRIARPTVVEGTAVEEDATRRRNNNAEKKSGAAKKKVSIEPGITSDNNKGIKTTRFMTTKTLEEESGAKDTKVVGEQVPMYEVDENRTSMSDIVATQALHESLSKLGKVPPIKIEEKETTTVIIIFFYLILL